MREILFKAKRKDNGEWVEGYIGVFKGIWQIFVPFTEEEEKTKEWHIFSAIGGLWYTVDPETLCEFTGLYDKNGKRIWENDIVKTKFGRLCKMVWRQTQCFVGWDFEVCDFDFGVNDFSKPPSSWDLYFPENLEVIGIFIDNPELLTAERIGEK